ncbi:MAG: DUF2304 domain-containing protein [Actinobacteria bacterium]|nr:DUF2304 domain-containing protein [Actinomycetota bacterium]
MSQETLQVIEIAVISVMFMVLIAFLTKRQRISFRYTVGWFVVFFISATAGLFVPLVLPIAELLQISTSMVFVGIVVIALLLISIQLSISISGLQRQLQDLAENVALLKERVEREDQE